MNTRVPSALMLVLIAMLATSWFVLRDLGDIRSVPATPLATAAGSDAGPQRPSARIGVISRFAPNVIYAGYQPIMDYLNRHGSHHYELALSTSYLDAVEHLRAGEVAASFLGAWIYAHLEADSALVPLVAPLNARGRSEFHAVLVVGQASTLRSPVDLRGGKVAVPSPQSWSGNWLQTTGLVEVGLSTADLDTIHHFDHHQTVAWQVLRGLFHAGVVKESVAAEFRREGLRELARSGPIPGPPLVGSLHAPPAVLAEIRDLLLALDPDDPDDRTVLASWTREFSHGFTAVDRQLYLEAFDVKERDR